jgi:hypothetical protein
LTGGRARLSKFEAEHSLQAGFGSTYTKVKVLPFGKVKDFRGVAKSRNPPEGGSRHTLQNWPAMVIVKVVSNKMVTATIRLKTVEVEDVMIVYDFLFGMTGIMRKTILIPLRMLLLC